MVLYKDSRFPKGEETVLVVDDEEPILKLIARVLEPLGYKILQAGDGADAVATASGHSGSIDLLLTDILMHGTIGSQVANVVRKKHPNIKVLYMSGYSNEEIRDRGICDTETDFLPKPFSSRNLASAVRVALDRDKC